MNDNTPNWVRELVGRGKMKGKVEFLDAKGRPRRYIDGVAVKIPEAELVNLRKSLQKKTMTTVGPLQKMTASGVKGIQITRGEKLFGVGEDPAKKLADAMNAAYSPKAKPPSKATIEGMVKRMAALSPTDKAKVMVLRRAATEPVLEKPAAARVRKAAAKGGPLKNTPESLAARMKAASGRDDGHQKNAEWEGLYAELGKMKPEDQTRTLKIANVDDNPNGTKLSRALNRGIRSAGRGIASKTEAFGRAAVHLKDALKKDASVRMSNVVRRWKMARDASRDVDAYMEDSRRAIGYAAPKLSVGSRIVEAWKRKRSQATFALMGNPKK